MYLHDKAQYPKMFKSNSVILYSLFLHLLLLHTLSFTHAGLLPLETRDDTSPFHPNPGLPAATAQTVAYARFVSDSAHGTTVSGFVTFAASSECAAATTVTGQFNTGFDVSSDPADYGFVIASQGNNWLPQLGFQIQNGGTSAFQVNEAGMSVDGEHGVLGGNFYVLYGVRVIGAAAIESV